MLFQAFDGGEEFEDHKKNQDKSGEDDGIDVALHTNKLSNIIGKAGIDSHDSHSAPNDNPNKEFQECLSFFPSDEIFAALKNHHAGDEDDGYLVEMKGGVHNVVILHFTNFITLITL
ncbi:MAG: hypothetical protein QG620_454 [Patescibacteria group bacterium]|nr:hypothetical protein [Patescibacteria group bacterium]